MRALLLHASRTAATSLPVASPSGSVKIVPRLARMAVGGFSRGRLARRRRPPRPIRARGRRHYTTHGSDIARFLHRPRRTAPRASLGEYERDDTWCAGVSPLRPARLRPAGRTPACERPLRQRGRHLGSRFGPVSTHRRPRVIAAQQRLAEEHFHQPHSGPHRMAQFPQAVDKIRLVFSRWRRSRSRTASFTCRLCADW